MRKIDYLAFYINHPNWEEPLLRPFVKKGQWLPCVSIDLQFMCEYMDAFEQKVSVLFDPINNVFLDSNWNEIDLKGKCVLPRGENNDRLLSEILKAGGTSILKLGDYEKTEHWYNFIDTGRNVKETTFKEFLESAKNINEGTEIFVKTVELNKWYLKTKERCPQHIFWMLWKFLIRKISKPRTWMGYLCSRTILSF